MEHHGESTRRAVTFRSAGLAAINVAIFSTMCTAAGVGGCGFVPPLPRTLEIPISEMETVRAGIGTGPQTLADSVWRLTRAPEKTYPRSPGGLVENALLRVEKPLPTESAHDIQGSERTSRERAAVREMMPNKAGDEPESAAPYAYEDDLRPYLPRPEVGETIFLVHFGSDGEMLQVTENEYLLPRLYGTEVPVGGPWVPTPLPALAFRSESYGMAEGERYGVAARFQVRFVTCPVARAMVYSYGEVTGDESAGVFGYTIDFTDGLLPFLGVLEDEYAARGERLSAPPP